MTCRHRSDEEMIDYIVGNLSFSETKKMAEEIDNCDECYEHFSYWSNLLTHSEDIEPSIHLKKSVMHSFKKEKRAKKREAMLRKWRPVFYAVAACLILSLITLRMLQYERTATDDLQRIIDIENTKHFQLISSSNHELDGQVFFNEQTNELYLYVDGLHSLTKEEQYHVWITTTDQTYLLGNMQWLDGRGLIYSSDHSFDFIDPILITVKKSPSSFMMENDLIIMQLSDK